MSLSFLISTLIHILRWDVPNDFGREWDGLGDLLTELIQPAEIHGRDSSDQADGSL